MPVGKHTWTEGISGWEQKEGHREGGPFTGGLEEALLSTWRWPRWHYGQPSTPTNNESHSLSDTFQENRTGFFFYPHQISLNDQTAASEATQKLHKLLNKNCPIDTDSPHVKLHLQIHTAKQLIRCKWGREISKISAEAQLWCGDEEKEKPVKFHINFRARSTIWAAFPTQRKLD